MQIFLSVELWLVRQSMIFLFWKYKTKLIYNFFIYVYNPFFCTIHCLIKKDGVSVKREGLPPNWFNAVQLLLLFCIWYIHHIVCQLLPNLDKDVHCPSS